MDIKKFLPKPPEETETGKFFATPLVAQPEEDLTTVEVALEERDSPDNEDELTILDVYEEYAEAKRDEASKHIDRVDLEDLPLWLV